MAVPMLSAQTGYGISAALNGISIFVTAFPMISLLIHYNQIKSKTNANDKAAQISISNDGTASNIDDKSITYGEYTFTDNMVHMKNFTILCLFSLFIRCIVSFILDIGRSSDWNVGTLTILVIIQATLYFVARTCLYSIFIIRIYFSFKGNKFAVSKCIINMLIITFVLMSLGFLLMMYFLISDNIFGFSITAAFAFLCDTVLSIAIVMLFLQRLKRISNNFGYNYDIDSDLNEIDAMIEEKKGGKMNKDELNYINIITRYSLISFIAIFSCIIWEYLVFADTLSIALNSSLNTPESISMIKLIAWILLPIDAVLNVWCIYYNNAFSTNLYYRMCGKCHNQCKKCLT